MNRSTDLEGVNDNINVSDLERAGLLDKPRFKMNDGVLRRQMRMPLVFMVLYHYLWLWKGRTDVSEQV